MIATRFGFDTNSRPEHVIAVADAALCRLRPDRIDLLCQNRVYPAVPIEIAAGAAGSAIEGERLPEAALKMTGL